MTPVSSSLDPLTMAVVANRLDAIVREMTSTMLRAGRSTVINSARDFSCALVTADDQLLASAEGLPIHTFGAHLQTAEMRRLHPDLAGGDAFLDNDPYVGNTHHADHTILVPVFVEDRHLFTAVAKAHQADIGNASPTTYTPFARDVYEEGALSFPCVRVQRDWTDVDDVIRTCRRRIRVPDQWHGDYLASLSAARTAERRLWELGEKYGVELLAQFVDEWLAYSERRMEAAIRKLPSTRLIGETAHDAFGEFGPIPLKVSLEIDAEAGRVEIDLRDNPDCLPAGINLSRATATTSVLIGLFNNLENGIPANSGSLRRVEVKLRENCVAGIPIHPTCCSLATTNVADRLVNLTQRMFAELGADQGIAEGGNSLGAAMAVLTGTDQRPGSPQAGLPYVTHMLLGTNGGPATTVSDGWLTWGVPVAAGLVYRDSVELIEQKNPVHVESLRLITDSGGPGRQRGAPTAEIVYGPLDSEMTISWVGDGHSTPPAGIHGGGSGCTAGAARIAADGTRAPLPPMGELVLQPGELVAANSCSGGGCGDPFERDPEAVLEDVRERWVSRARAESVYGVVLAGDERDPRIDVEATRRLRRSP